MSTKPLFAAVERFLAVQFEITHAAKRTADRAENEALLNQARKELEEAANAEASRAGIRRIIAAVDHAHHPAIEAALKIAQPLGAQIAVVHVLEPLPASNLEMAYDLTSEFEETRAAAKALLAKFQEEIPANLMAFTALREGHAAEQILAAAKEFNADLIVIGTHRRGALARFFMGSTSQAVLRQAQCPVMFVTDAFAEKKEAEAHQQA